MRKPIWILGFGFASMAALSLLRPDSAAVPLPAEERADFVFVDKSERRIHGLPNAWPVSVAPKLDWTQGCIALDNAEIEEVWALVPDGTPIRIVP